MRTHNGRAFNEKNGGKKRMSQVWAEATDICEVSRYMMPAYRAATEGSEAPLENCPD